MICSDKSYGGKQCKELYLRKNCKRMRLSSYDRTGKNGDSFTLDPGIEHAIPEIMGTGVIRHIWLTVGKENTSYENIRLQIQFDDCEMSNVDCTFSEFFILGHGENCRRQQSADSGIQTTASARISVYRFVELLFSDAPFKKGLDLKSKMLQTQRFQFSIILIMSFMRDLRSRFYISMQLFMKSIVIRPRVAKKCLMAKSTKPAPICLYKIITGCSIFRDIRAIIVGTALFVDCRNDCIGKWWEGDDMFVIDGECWPPRLHGTGTEDYFNLAWGFRKVECRPEYGITFLSKSEQDTSMIDGKFSLYRFHISDPIVFEHSLLATLEHGHANDCEVHYKSVAYWYGRKV